MRLLDHLLGRIGFARRAPQPVTVMSGRPTYAQALGIATLPRPLSYELLTQYSAAIPLVSRSVDILSGFVGAPTFVSKDKSVQDELERFSREVRYGALGRGLASWLPDHLGQVLLYGCGVGELEVESRRAGVSRLWSYRTPAFGFRSDPCGELEILQQQSMRGLVTLNPATVLHTAYSPEGCDPHGTSLFASCHRFCQGLVDAFAAHHATWGRIGQPIFQVSWLPPTGFSDPEGKVAQIIRPMLESGWNAAMKSQAVDGVASDFFTAGDVRVKVIGTDGMEMDITVSARAFGEEIIAATGIPPFCFGLSWSTTERMSSVQADLLTTTINGIRTMTAGTLAKVVNTHLTLVGKAGAAWELVWPEMSLQDQREISFAEHFHGLAQRSRQQLGRQLWADGVYDQRDYAEFVTGKRTVARATPAPLPLPIASGDSDEGAEGQGALSLLAAGERKEFDALALPSGVGEEYRGVFKHACDGRH